MSPDRVFDLTPDQAVGLWPEIDALLAPLLAKDGRYVTVDVLAAHIRGEMKLWVSIDPEEKEVEAVLVAQLVTYPRIREFHVSWVAGRNMAAWHDEAERKTEAFARVHGCKRLTVHGRRGWLRNEDAREMGTIMVRDL